MNKLNPDFKIEFPPGSTPLNADEAGQLILKYITTQKELNAAEQDNILQAEQWVFIKKRKEVLTEKFFRDVHKKMYSQVWQWAGVYRTSNKTIGVEWHHIPTEISKIISDVQYWIQHQTFSMDEIAARFHHRLVWIHPFVNGNGRWARLMADCLLVSLGHERFTWGSVTSSGQQLFAQGEVREEYIKSLQLADSRNFLPLIKFVRS